MTAKVKAPTRSAMPKSKEEADGLIQEIGRMQTEGEALKAAMKSRIAEVRQGYQARLEEIASGIDRRTETLEAWAAVHRDALTNGGRVKWARLPSGRILWRNRPPGVTLRGVADVIAAIKEARLSKKFLRLKEEINKNAMLDDPERAARLPGVTIGSGGEEFVVEPFGLDTK